MSPSLSLELKQLAGTYNHIESDYASFSESVQLTLSALEQNY